MVQQPGGHSAAIAFNKSPSGLWKMNKFGFIAGEVSTWLTDVNPLLQTISGDVEKGLKRP